MQAIPAQLPAEPAAAPANAEPAHTPQTSKGKSFSTHLDSADKKIRQNNARAADGKTEKPETTRSNTSDGPEQTHSQGKATGRQSTKSVRKTDKERFGSPSEQPSVDKQDGSIRALAMAMIGEMTTPASPDDGTTEKPAMQPGQLSWPIVSDQVKTEETAIKTTGRLRPESSQQSSTLSVNLDNLLKNALPSRQATQPTRIETGSQLHQAEQNTIVIENWQARFSYQGASVQATGQQEWTEIGQSTNHSGGSLTSLHQQQNQRQDANAHFIHSNLPNVSGTEATDGQSANNNQTAGNGNQKPTPQTESPEPTPGHNGGQNAPMIFSLDQESGSLQATQHNQSTTTGLTVRLPSGAEIPHTHILNQITNRFSMNRALESGTITLRLQPAELGELRMEIKVEQDNIKAHITTQNPQVQEILDRHLPRLREALEQQGLSLEQMTVSLATDSDANSQTFHEQFERNRMQQKTVRPMSGLSPFSLDGEEDDETGIHTTANNNNLSVVA